MKKLLLLPLVFIGALAVKAQPTTSADPNPNAPVMTFTEKEYKFGNIKQGESVTYEFKFKNTGKEPLIIASAVGSCGCTVPKYPQEPIKPGASGVITVTFNSTGKMGPQDKTVTLTYNEGKTEVLHMIGNVEAAPSNGTATPQPAPAVQKAQPVTPAPAPAPAAADKKAPAAPANTNKPKN
ncbi:MAG: hypothetical protein Fur0041_05720 [Bacteroidia bacterium]